MECANLVIATLEPLRGGYYYIKIAKEIVNQFRYKRKTRLICTLEDSVEFRCGLNHLGDGNFFIIISRENLSRSKKNPGDIIEFEITEDPSPLGVEMPEDLEVLLQQDPALGEIFERLSAGKKRGIIYQIIRIKSIDKRIDRAIKLIREASLLSSTYGLDEIVYITNILGNP